MRTNIEIDDRLMSEARRSSGKCTKRAVVEAGLRAARADTGAREDAAVAGQDPVAWGPRDFAGRTRVQVGRQLVIVDTTVWIDYLTGVRNAETDWLDRDLDRQRLD